MTPTEARLFAENALLRADNARLLKAVEDLTAQVTVLGNGMATSNTRIAELLAIVSRTKNQRKPAVEKPPALAMPLPSQAGLDSRPTPPVIPEKVKPEPKTGYRTGRKPLPEHLPIEKTESRPCECGDCGHDGLDLVDTFIEEKLHVIKQHVRRRVVVRYTVRCRKCLIRTTGETLPAPYARSKVTCEFLAWLIVQKFYLLVPLDKIRNDLELKGIKLSMGTLVGFIERAADALSKVDGQQWRDLLDGGRIASDGTGINVLIRGLPTAYKGYLEVYRWGETVVFQYEAQKDAATLTSKLGAFKGVMLTDAEHRFNEVFANGDVLEAGCNAHGRRRFEAAEAVQPVLAAEAGRFVSAMFLADEAAKTAGLVDEALRTWRQERIAPLYVELRSWMDAVEPTLLPTDALAETIRYYRNHWKALTLWLDIPELPPDNSGSEREFQTVAKARLSWLFAGSTEGAHRAAILLGIVATARNHRIDVQEYLTWVFERVGTHALEVRDAVRRPHPGRLQASASTASPPEMTVWAG